MSYTDKKPEVELSEEEKEKEFQQNLKTGFKNYYGRPTSYRPEFDAVVLRLAAEGNTMAGICSHFLVSRSTLYRWAEERPGFQDTLDMARELQQRWMEEIANKHATEQRDGEKLNTTLWNFRMSRTIRDYKEQMQTQVVINKHVQETTIPEEVKDKLDTLEAKIRNSGK